MVYDTRRYHCGHCHKDFPDEDGADLCERNHIVDAAAKGFRSDFGKILGKHHPGDTYGGR